MPSLRRLIGSASLLYSHSCFLTLHTQAFLPLGTTYAAFGQSSFPSSSRSISIINPALFSTMTNSDDSITNLPRVDFDKTETIGTTRWMRLETLSYHVPPEKDDNNDNNNNNNNTLRKWDRAVRTTKKSENSIDAVIILAILKNDADDPTKDEIVCVKQFRPPVDAYTIELPAGLIDADEDVASAATREFEEETGYVGEVASVSPNASYLSPGLTNESASLVRLEVDMTLDRNIRNHESRKLSDGLEGCEKDRGLEKLLLPRVGLLEALHGLQEEEGVKVFTALYSLALGMSVSETKRGV